MGTYGSHDGELTYAAIFSVRQDQTSCVQSLLTQLGNQLQHRPIRNPDSRCVNERNQSHTLSLYSNIRNVRHQLLYIYRHLVYISNPISITWERGVYYFRHIPHAPHAPRSRNSSLPQTTSHAACIECHRKILHPWLSLNPNQTIPTSLRVLTFPKRKPPLRYHLHSTLFNNVRESFRTTLLLRSIYTYSIFSPHSL